VRPCLFFYRLSALLLQPTRRQVLQSHRRPVASLTDSAGGALDRTCWQCPSTRPAAGLMSTDPAASRSFQPTCGSGPCHRPAAVLIDRPAQCPSTDRGRAPPTDPRQCPSPTRGSALPPTPRQCPSTDPRQCSFHRTRGSAPFHRPPAVPFHAPQCSTHPNPAAGLNTPTLRSGETRPS
jgi:hypothetical protein